MNPFVAAALVAVIGVVLLLGGETVWRLRHPSSIHQQKEGHHDHVQ